MNVAETHPAPAAPSPWVCRFAPLLGVGASVLDVAAGSGRHARYLAGLGMRVEAVDRDHVALAALRGVPGVSTRVADLEDGTWPYADCKFDCIVVTNYLHRPLFRALCESLSAGGLLIYETFAVGNERYGRPSNPDFLLKSGELIEVVRGRFRVVCYEDIHVDIPKPAMVQRICAVSMAN